MTHLRLHSRTFLPVIGSATDVASSLPRYPTNSASYINNLGYLPNHLVPRRETSSCRFCPFYRYFIAAFICTPWTVINPVINELGMLIQSKKISVHKITKNKKLQKRLTKNIPESKRWTKPNYEVGFSPLEYELILQ